MSYPQVSESPFVLFAVVAGGILFCFFSLFLHVAQIGEFMLFMSSSLILSPPLPFHSAMEPIHPVFYFMVIIFLLFLFDSSCLHFAENLHVYAFLYFLNFCPSYF